MSKASILNPAADVADIAQAWKQLTGRRSVRWDGVADDDLDLVDDRRLWQASRRRERHERRRERDDESLHVGKRGF